MLELDKSGGCRLLDPHLVLLHSLAFITITTVICIAARFKKSQARATLTPQSPSRSPLHSVALPSCGQSPYGMMTMR